MSKPTLTTKLDTRFECVGVSCRSWYCPTCMVGKALALRRDLEKAVATFRGVFMLTFTVDPKIFKNARKELEYVAKKRAIAKVVAKLREEEKLFSDRFFCIREFHKDGRVHYHVLLDAAFVDIHRVRELWGKYEPKDYERDPDDKSPRFGSVHYSKRKLEDRLHAARYVTKYLTKQPDEGFPDWVMEIGGRLQRYTVSHRFWSESGVACRGRQKKAECERPREEEPCADECFCDKCVGDDADSLKAVRGATIGKRVENCDTESALMRVDIWETDGHEVIEVKQFLAKAPDSPKEIAERYGISAGRRFTMRPSEVAELIWEEDDPGEIGEAAKEFLLLLDSGEYDDVPMQSAADRRHAWGRRKRDNATPHLNRAACRSDW